MTITTAPFDPRGYAVGETIGVQVTFSEAVTVSGSPLLKLGIGENVRDAVWNAEASDGAFVAFRYVVTLEDRDEDGVSIDVDALDASDGTIESAKGVQADLGIGDHVIADDGNHLVLGSPPEAACADQRELAMTHTPIVVSAWDGTPFRVDIIRNFPDFVTDADLEQLLAPIGRLADQIETQLGYRIVEMGDLVEVPAGAPEGWDQDYERYWRNRLLVSEPGELLAFYLNDDNQAWGGGGSGMSAHTCCGTTSYNKRALGLMWTGDDPCCQGDANQYTREGEAITHEVFHLLGFKHYFDQHELIGVQMSPGGLDRPWVTRPRSSMRPGRTSKTCGASSPRGGDDGQTDTETAEEPMAVLLTNLEGLVLGGNLLSGEIPPELGQLVNLTYLDLSDNQLSGEVPPELGQLSKLTDLALSQNRLTGEIPPELVTLVNLQWLALDGNASLCVPWGAPFDSWIDGMRPLGTQLPGFFGERCPFAEMIRAGDWAALKALYHATDGDNWNNNSGWLNETPPFEQWHGVRRDANVVVALDLIGNRLRGTIPSELGQLADLEVLDLRLNHLRGAIPAELGQLANLEKLNFYANDELSGPIPPELGQLANLTELTLGRNRLSGTIPAELGQLANLEYLALFTNELSGTIPAALGQLANLRVLDIANNAFNGTIPTELGELTNLTGLHLGNNALSGTIPSEFGRLTALTRLDLVSNPAMSGELPSELTNLMRLEWLRLPSGVCIPWGEPFDSWLDSVVARSEYPHLVSSSRCHH